MPRPCRSLPVVALAVLLALCVSRTRAADDDPPPLARALFLEKTSREPEKALPLFEAVVADSRSSPADRTAARFGVARCHEAAGRLDAAIAALAAIEAAEGTPPADREDARVRREALARARTSAADRDAQARARDEIHRAEVARQEREGRLAVAQKLYETAVAHVKEKRYEDARQCLLEALERNPGDARAAALLDEVGGRVDRGDLLKQAVRFVASNRVADLARLTSDVDALRKRGQRALKEGRASEAVDVLRTAVARIDESDFYGELESTRRELVAWFGKALAEAKAKGDKIDGAAIPAERRTDGAAGGVKPWRAEFFALLGRIFASREDGGAPVRFYDAAIPADPAPEAAGTHFSGSGIASSLVQGTLRRSRWIERYLRHEVSPGTWSGPDRLLDRYEDLVVVQHGPAVLKAVDALTASFPASPAPPLAVEIRLYAATPEGLLDATKALEAVATPSEEGLSAIVRMHSLEEQETLLEALPSVRLLARASLRLTGRRTATVRLREPTSSSPPYAEKTTPPVSIPDRFATYGLDLELYGESLVGGTARDAALSIVARVHRPDRPRLAPLQGGWVRWPVFVEQSLEADRRVPAGASVVLYGLSNPFRATGYAGDPAGGSHPDLLVLVSARPSDAVATPDVAPPPLPIPGEPPPTRAPSELSTRDYDLGSVGRDVADEPPPEDWPLSTFAAGKGAVGHGSRDAFLAGWIADQVRLPADEGPLLVRDGKVTATASAGSHGRIGAAVEALRGPADRLIRLDVDTIELAADRAKRLLADTGVRAETPDQRVFRVDAKASALFAEKLGTARDPTSLYECYERLAARHTQLVTARSIRSRAIIEEIRSERRDDGATVLAPVHGTVEEGVVVSVRPVVLGASVVSVYATAILAGVEKIDEWRPEGLPPASPMVALPRHRVERAAAVGALAENESLLLIVPVPGAEGARVVIVRVRLPRAI